MSKKTGGVERRPERFPKGGIALFPKELTSIEKVKHKHHVNPLTRDRRKEELMQPTEKPVTVHELRSGLKNLGLSLTTDQVKRLQCLSGSEALNSIMQFSTQIGETGDSKQVSSGRGPHQDSTGFVAGRSYGHSIKQGAVASKTFTKNMRNKSDHVSKLIIESKGDETESTEAFKLNSPRRAVKNRSEPLRVLLDNDANVADDLLTLVTPKSSRRASNASMTEVVHSGKEVKSLLKSGSVERRKSATKDTFLQVRERQGSKKDRNVIRNVKAKLLSTYGSDLSKFEDCFTSMDKSNSGVITTDAFRDVLASKSGIALNNNDFEVLTRHWTVNNGKQIPYGWLVENLSDMAKKILPDQSFHQVTAAEKRHLSIHRTIGSKLLEAFGHNNMKAYDECRDKRSGKVTFQSLLNKLEKDLGVRLGNSDKALVKLELERHGGNLHDLAPSAFNQVLIGPEKRNDTNNVLWEDENKLMKVHYEKKSAKSVEQLERAQLLARVRDFVERKHAWGAGMRDVFLTLDEQKTGRIPRHSLVRGLRRLGLVLDPKEASVLTEALMEPGKDVCTYHSFARPITRAATETECMGNEDNVKIHNFKQKRHVGSNPKEHFSYDRPSCTMEQVVDYFRTKGKPLYQIYLHVKQDGSDLSWDRLHHRLEECVGCSINVSEFESFAKENGRLNRSCTNVEFDQFQRLISSEAPTGSSYDRELQRKIPKKLLLQRVAKTCYETPHGKRMIQGSRAKVLLTPELPLQTGKVLHLKTPPPPPPKSSIPLT